MSHLVYHVQHAAVMTGLVAALMLALVLLGPLLVATVSIGRDGHDLCVRLAA